MNDLKKADNFYKNNNQNDLSLSLEASFRYDKDKNGDDDFGGFLNDPDDLNIGVTN